MERIIQGRSATLTHTFQSDGVATDPSPDTATVTIVRSDGTSVVTGASATEAGTGKVTYTVTPAQTALLDSWTVTWTATFGGQVQTFKEYVEVAGDVLFSVAQALAVAPTATVASIIDARIWAECALENACGVAFVPRFAVETLNGSGGQRMEPRWPKLRALRSASVDGLAVDVTGVVIEMERFFTRPFNYWRPWPANTVLRYEHGMDFPPPEISVAALELARYKLTSDSGTSTIDPRTESIITQDGTLRLAMAGQQGQRFGIPDVDAVVAAYSELSVW